MFGYHTYTYKYTKGNKMQKKVTITIDEDINTRWGNVAKKLKMSKSGMVEEFIESILPILEAKTPNKMMAKAMKEMGNTIDLTANLLDGIEENKEINWG